MAKGGAQGEEGEYVTFSQRADKEGVIVSIRRDGANFYEEVVLDAKGAEKVANELASGLLGIKYDAFSCTTTQPVVK